MWLHSQRLYIQKDYRKVLYLSVSTAVFHAHLCLVHKLIVTIESPTAKPNLEPPIIQVKVPLIQFFSSYKFFEGDCL